MTGGRGSGPGPLLLVADLGADALDRAVAREADERGDDRRVEVLAGVGLDRREPTLGAPGLFVGPLGGQRVVDVRDGHDPRGERDVLALLLVRVAGAVPPLVVLPSHRTADREELRVAEHRFAVDAVLLHRLELIR